MSESSKRSLPASSAAFSNKKKKLQESSQSNTLLGYTQFSAFEKKLPAAKPVAVQSSILSFFRSSKTDSSTSDSSIKQISESEVKVELVKTEPCVKIIEEIDSDDELLSKIDLKSVVKSKNLEIIDKHEEKFEDIENSATNASNRKCPFYKRIDGTRIAVDAFSYGTIPSVDAYFLSHFHYDHYMGLGKSFQHKMFCSQITANLVVKKIRVDPKYITPLEMNKFLKIYENNDSIHVALLDANHCPGSVMFLFRLKQNGKYKYVLHTGDFRAADNVITNPMLKNIQLDTVHMDTTYCDSYYKFLPQSQVMAIGADLVYREVKKQPKALIVCGSYTIGKERVVIAIAEKLNVKICVTKDKMNILGCFNDENLNKILTLNPNETNLHVLQMGQLNTKDLEEYLGKFPSYSYLIAIKPTGWTHTHEVNLSQQPTGFCIDKKSKRTIIYGLEYSEHSSFEELRNFVKAFRPKKIIPHVNVAKKESRDKMTAYFNEWMRL